jgi:hypothetical protein
VKISTIGKPLAIASASLVLANVASASDQDSRLFFQPRAEFGILDYEFSVDDLVLADGGFGDGFELQDTLIMGGVGGVIFYEGFFLDIAGRHTLDGSDSGQQFLADIVNGAPVAATHDYDATFDRWELDALVGYEIARSENTGTSAFVGFRYAQTNIEMETTTVGPIFNGILIAPSTQVFDGTVDTEIAYSGPYIGVSSWIKLKFLPGKIT